MTILPVIGRELRQQSRQRSTHGIRFLAASVVLGVELMLLGLGRPFEPEGRHIFLYLQSCLFLGIWIVVPMLVCDCISRERREGTLGLLFLTPLVAADVVLAKGFVQGLRIVMAGLAVLPVLMLPFLLGGISWRDVAFTVTLNLSAFLLAMAAGLLASSRQIRFQNAMVWAYLWAFIYFWLLLLWFRVAHGGAAFLSLGDMSWLRLMWITVLSPDDLSRFLGLSDAALSWTAVGQRLAMLLVFAGLVFLAVVWRAAGNTRRAVLVSEKPAWRRKLQDALYRPRFAVGFYRRWLSRRLSRNPIGWLEQRTWQARTVSWGWLGTLVAVYSYTVMETRWFANNFSAVQGAVMFFFMVSILVTASGSFHRERQNGLFELLLVTPLTVRQVIFGRLRGIWFQFLPSLVLIIVVDHFMSGALIWGRRSGMEWCREMAGLVSVFLLAPVISLYASLRCRHLVTAAGGSFLFVVAIPWLVIRVIDRFVWRSYWGFGGLSIPFETVLLVASVLPLAYLLVMSRIAWRLLYRGIENRRLVMRES